MTCGLVRLKIVAFVRLNGLCDFCVNKNLNTIFIEQNQNYNHPSYIFFNCLIYMVTHHISPCGLPVRPVFGLPCAIGRLTEHFVSLSASLSAIFSVSASKKTGEKFSLVYRRNNCSFLCNKDCNKIGWKNTLSHQPSLKMRLILSTNSAEVSPNLHPAVRILHYIFFRDGDSPVKSVVTQQQENVILFTMDICCEAIANFAIFLNVIQ